MTRIEDLDDADELAALFGGTEKAKLVGPATEFVPILERVYTDKCKACRGSGRFVSWAGRDCGPCFKCKGKGERTYKTAPDVRAANRDATAAKKIEKADAWKAEHADVIAWIAASPEFGFAVAMRDALAKFGSLTDNQVAACRKCIAARAKAVEARKVTEAAAPTITVAKIEQAFTAASAKGLKWPALNLDTFKFKPASSTSKNAGSIYVTENETYLGRITDGRFVCTRECGGDRQARVLAAAADPEAAAVAYGKRTGSCSCCGRELTNEESITRGIGPICAMKYGW